jgi:PTH2 family peptidyl-tRNA hydrolase
VDTKQVIVLRTDLNMRKGKMAAQAAHASMKVFFDRATLMRHADEKVPYLMVKMWNEARDWFLGAFAKVVVGIDSEEGLLELQKQADTAGIPSAIIVDSGRTEFHGVSTRTALAIGPDEAAKIDKITGSLKLL